MDMEVCQIREYPLNQSKPIVYSVSIIINRNIRGNKVYVIAINLRIFRLHIFMNMFYNGQVKLHSLCVPWMNKYVSLYDCTISVAVFRHSVVFVIFFFKLNFVDCISKE